MQLKEIHVYEYANLNEAFEDENFGKEFGKLFLKEYREEIEQFIINDFEEDDIELEGFDITDMSQLTWEYLTQEKFSLLYDAIIENSDNLRHFSDTLSHLLEVKYDWNKIVYWEWDSNQEFCRFFVCDVYFNDKSELYNLVARNFKELNASTDELVIAITEHNL